MTADELAALLAAGERAAFHGRPGAGVDPLRRAAELAAGDGLVAEASAAAWLLGVCLSSAGRFGGALDVLDPAGRPSPTTAESRMLRRPGGGHDGQRAPPAGPPRRGAGYDETRARGIGGAGEAGFDALPRAGVRRGRAGRGRARRGPPGRGRRAGGGPPGLVAPAGPARLGAARGRPARRAARRPRWRPVQESVDLAEQSGAPRHVAKGLLFHGVALVEAGRPDEAAAVLRRAGLLAESLGTLPLLWPVRAVLGALLAADSPEESEQALESARRAVAAIADDLPEPLRAGLARPRRRRGAARPAEAPPGARFRRTGQGGPRFAADEHGKAPGDARCGR